MGYLKLLAVLLFIVSGTAMAGGPVPPLYWYEQDHGDAGDRFRPQNITGGPYDGIAGSIGGDLPPDPVDAFRFVLNGTSLSVETCLGCPPPDRVILAATTMPMPLDSIGTALYRDGPTPSMIPPFSQDPFSQDNTPPTNTKTWTELTDGATYIIEFTYGGMDPPFTLTSLGGPILAAAPIPEPSTWALMLAGLAGIVVMTRRRISS